MSVSVSQTEQPCPMCGANTTSQEVVCPDCGEHLEFSHQESSSIEQYDSRKLIWFRRQMLVLTIVWLLLGSKAMYYAFVIRAAYIRGPHLYDLRPPEEAKHFMITEFLWAISYLIAGISAATEKRWGLYVNVGMAIAHLAWFLQSPSEAVTLTAMAIALLALTGFALKNANDLRDAGISLDHKI